VQDSEESRTKRTKDAFPSMSATSLPPCAGFSVGDECKGSAFCLIGKRWVGNFSLWRFCAFMTTFKIEVVIINERPRKKLNFATPTMMFYKQFT